MYQGTEIDLSPPWRRVTMSDAVKDKLEGFDMSTLPRDDPQSVTQACEAATAAGVPDVAGLKSVGQILNACFEHLCEEELIQVRVCVCGVSSVSASEWKQT